MVNKQKRMNSQGNKNQNNNKKQFLAIKFTRKKNLSLIISSVSQQRNVEEKSPFITIATSEGNSQCLLDQTLHTLWLSNPTSLDLL